MVKLGHKWGDPFRHQIDQNSALGQKPGTLCAPGSQSDAQGSKTFPKISKNITNIFKNICHNVIRSGPKVCLKRSSHTPFQEDFCIQRSTTSSTNAIRSGPKVFHKHGCQTPFQEHFLRPKVFHKRGCQTPFQEHFLLH